MNRIEELIAQHCPDGVEFFKIGQLAQVGTGSSDRKNASAEGEYPFYVRPKDVMRIGSYEFDEEAIVIPGEGGIGEIFHYVRGKYALHQRAYRIRFTDDRVNTRFAYYYFSATFKSFILRKAVSATVTSIRKPMITDFPFPVPPLEVQRAIVEILDTFSKLEAELEAELEARKQQYEHYRSLLLSGDEQTGSVSLHQIAKYSDTRIEASSLDSSTFIGVDNLIADKRGKVEASYLPNTNRLTAYEPGDILIGNIRPYLKKIWLAENQGGCSGDVLAIRILEESRGRVDPSYLYYLMSSDSFFTYNMQHAKGAKMPRGNKNAILNYQISLPSMPEQRRIVAILDKFDALVNDLSRGLPAELAARRQQYEYYRDKLLTFKPLAAVAA